MHSITINFGPVQTTSPRFKQENLAKTSIVEDISIELSNFMPATQPRVRNWCFTSYDCDGLLTPELWDASLQIDYCVYQQEICPDTQRHHFQGYLHSKVSLRLAALKQIPGLETAHFEVARGTPQDNKTYCTKSETRVDGPYEFGTIDLAGQGRRTDISGIVQLIKQGKSELDVAEHDTLTYLRYFKGLDRLRTLYTKPRDFQTELYLVLGPPGLGKTTFVLDESPNAHWKNRTDFWDGFNGEQDIVLDDFAGTLPFDELLRIVNPAPYQLNIKGGTVILRSKRLFITSNTCPESWWKRDHNLAPLFRRITGIYVFFAIGECHLFKALDGRTAWQQFEEHDCHRGYFHAPPVIIPGNFQPITWNHGE